MSVDMNILEVPQEPQKMIVDTVLHSFDAFFSIDSPYLSRMWWKCKQMTVHCTILLILFEVINVALGTQIYQKWNKAWQSYR